MSQEVKENFLKRNLIKRKMSKDEMIHMVTLSREESQGKGTQDRIAKAQRSENYRTYWKD